MTLQLTPTCVISLPREDYMGAARKIALSDAFTVKLLSHSSDNLDYILMLIVSLQACHHLRIPPPPSLPLIHLFS